jgi:N-glycosylase/DNA lyase
MARRRCKNGRRADGKCRKTAASGGRRRSSVKSTRLFSDVTQFIRTTKRKRCGSPERMERTQRAISYLRSAAANEASNGLNKTVANRRIAGLRRVAKQVVASMKQCVKRQKKAKSNWTSGSTAIQVR